MKLKAWIFFQNGDARQASLSKLHGFFPKIVIILLITINYHQLNLNKNQMFCLVSMVSGQQFSHFGQHLVWSAVLQEKVSILARPKSWDILPNDRKFCHLSVIFLIMEF